MIRADDGESLGEMNGCGLSVRLEGYSGGVMIEWKWSMRHLDFVKMTIVKGRVRPRMGETLSHSFDSDSGLP